MTRSTVTTVLVLLMVASAAAPATAASGDRVWEDEGIVLSPHDGPNGVYAEIDADGNLTVDFDGESVNPNAITVFENVFDVQNDGTTAYDVWVTHDATDSVEFRTDADSIQGRSNATRVAPGETVPIDIEIDSYGHGPGETLLDEVSIHAERTTASSSTTTDDGGGGGGSSASTDGDSTTGATPTPTPTPTGSVVTVGTVRVELDRRLEPDETVDVARLGSLPPDPVGADVSAVIVRRGADATVSIGPPDRLEAYGVHSVVTEGDPATFSSAGTLVGSAAGIDRERRLVGAYEVTVPPRLRDSGGTLFVTVNRSRFPGGDPESARAARLRSDGWELLATEVARENRSHVVLRARTPGFSTFAVFAGNDMQFRWSVEERGRFRGPTATVTYDQPGRYNATLTVTDALGRTDTATHRLLVNDRPSVRIEAPASIEANRVVTLRAVVTDQYGEPTVRWQFGDGATVTGASVSRRFAEGVHRVRVTVSDGLGGTATVGRRLVVGSGPALDVVEFALGLEGRIGLVALLALAVLATIRWLRGRRGRRRRRSR